MLKFKQIFPLCVLMLFTAFAPLLAESHQGIRVTGTITDNSGVTLPGVNVMVKGTTIGTTADMNGEFAITVPDENSVLQFSFVGFQPKEMIVGNRRIIALSMDEDTAMFEEVVVVAFGRQKRQNTVASIA